MAFGQLEDGQRPGRPISEINVTPLVDVMLVLVVIFILTAPILASSIRLDLPKASGKASQAQPAPAPAPHLLLAVDRTGQAFLGDQPVSLAELTQRFRQVAAEDASTELHLRADQAAPYGRVAELLGAAQSAGLYRIGFMTEPAPATQTPAKR